MAKPHVEHGQTRKLGEMKPHPRNSRAHSEAQIEQIVAAMGEWDWTVPMLVDDKGFILAGHARQLAGLRKWGPDHDVPVSVAVGWTEQKKRAYVIADNRLTELSSWDHEILKAEITEMKIKDFDLSPLGFSAIELEAILQPPAEVLAPAPPAPKGSRIANPVEQFNIVFDDAAQKEVWMAFMRRLKAQYPDRGTLGSQLAEFLKEWTTA